MGQWFNIGCKVVGIAGILDKYGLVSVLQREREADNLLSSFGLKQGSCGCKL